MLSGPWFAGQEGGNDEKRLGIQTLESKRKAPNSVEENSKYDRKKIEEI